MMTVGGSWPCLAGVLPPLAPGAWGPMLLPYRSGTPGLPGGPSWVWAPRAPWSPWTALLGGSGLLRISFKVEEEDDGVSTGDWLASLEAAFGEAVPSFESLFFLEDLLESPRLESFKYGKVSNTLATRYGQGLTTLAPKRFILEDNSFSSVGRLEAPSSNCREPKRTFGTAGYLDGWENRDQIADSGPTLIRC
jgi:hypothetical protein